MDSYLEKPQKENGNSKILLVSMLIGALLVAGLVGFFIFFSPSKQVVEKQSMEGAVREGSPEFAELTKKIAIQTDENNTMQSPTGMGTITMFIAGKVRNFTGKTLTGLEIKATVVDQLEQPVKEKILTVVPNQQDTLETSQTMPVKVMIEGFSKDDDRAMIRWKVTAIKVQ